MISAFTADTIFCIIVYGPPPRGHVFGAQITPYRCRGRIVQADLRLINKNKPAQGSALPEGPGAFMRVCC